MSAGRRVAVQLGLVNTPEREAELAAMSHGRRFLSALDLVLAWQLAVGAVLASAVTGGLDAVPAAALAAAVFLAACYGVRTLVRRRRLTS